MNDHFCALNMAQKFMSQPYALGSPLYKPRDIRYDKTSGMPVFRTSVQIHHTQIRIQSGKMVIGYLGFRIGHPGQKSRFPYVWQAYQAYIRNHLQLQQQFKLLCRTSGLGIHGRLHGAGGIMLVPAAASAAF